MIYEWARRSPHFPNCGARIYDAATGEHIDKVRYIDTETNELRRFATGPNGGILQEGPKRIPVLITEFRAVRIEWRGDMPVVDKTEEWSVN